MAVSSLSSPTQEHLRPFDINCDLNPVADLVEQCFADTLDPDGMNYLRQMRSAARNPVYLRWASVSVEQVSMPLSGYVWVEDNRVVGNLTLIPFTLHGRRSYLIANVAVHPDYRRRGIARSLTIRALEHARRKASGAVWLHVREDNQAALHLYRSLEFRERARRTTWQNSNPASGRELRPEPLPLVRVIQRQPGHWTAQRAWLDALYPSEINWHLNLNVSALKPGLLAGLYRLFADIQVRQWSLAEGDRLLGVATWQSALSYTDHIWLAAPPDTEGFVAQVLLQHIQARMTTRRRPLTLDYPAGQAVQGIQAAGFEPKQTLIWMEQRL